MDRQRQRSPHAGRDGVPPRHQRRPAGRRRAARHPTARALAQDRFAWAHTRAGEAQAAMRALGLAHEALADSDDELDVMDARVFTELHRPLRAVPLLTEVLGRYDPTHAREVALYLSWLAVALADANEPEEAAATTERMLSLNVTSERAAARTRIVLRRLECWPPTPSGEPTASARDELTEPRASTWQLPAKW